MPGGMAATGATGNGSGTDGGGGGGGGGSSWCDVTGTGYAASGDMPWMLPPHGDRCCSDNPSGAA